MKPSRRVSNASPGKSPFEVVEVTGSERDRLLNLDEGHFIDLKGIDIAPAKLTRTIASFANASGGEIYVGIAEEEFFGAKTRLWNGFKDPEAANAHIQVLAAMFPLGSEYSCEFLRSLGSVGLVLHITV